MSYNGTTLTFELNRLAGTLSSGVPQFDGAKAANIWAGTSGFDLVGALNIKAGTKGVDLGGVCNILAGTSGLQPVVALSTL